MSTKKISIYTCTLLMIFGILGNISYIEAQGTTGQSNVRIVPQTATGGVQGSPNISNVGGKSFQQLITDIIIVISGYVIRLLVALSVFMFLYGIMVYMFKGQGSDTARTEGRKLMLWGVIGLFVITSVWGLVSIASSIIGHTDIGTPQFRK